MKEVRALAIRPARLISSKTTMNIVRNVPYRQTEQGALHFDLYDPEADDATLLIFIGDGVHRGDMDGRLLYPLLAAHYAVATISYRDFADCHYAMRWLQTNLADYNLITDALGVWGVRSGGFMALQLGIRGAVEAVCTMQVDFPKSGLHEDIATRPAVFLMLQATDHPNMRHMTQLDAVLRQAKVSSQLVTLDSTDLSDEAAETIGATLVTFFDKWVKFAPPISEGL